MTVWQVPSNKIPVRTLVSDLGMLASTLAAALLLYVADLSAQPSSCGVCAHLTGSRVGDVRRQVLPGRNVSTVLVHQDAFVISDISQARLLKFDGSGKLQWATKGAGIGPGELTYPSVVQATAPAGYLVVDVGSKSLVFLDSTGAQTRRTNLGLAFSYVSDAVALPSEIVIAGITSDPRGKSFALHAFTSDMVWKRSFSPIPSDVDQRVLVRSGPGLLVRRTNGTFLFLPRYTAFIEEYDQGEHKRKTTWPLPANNGVGLPPILLSEKQGGETSITPNPSAAIAGRPIALSEQMLLVTISAHDVLTSFAVRRKGEPILLDTRKKGEPIPFAFDVDRCDLYFRQSRAGSIVVLWAPLRADRPDQPFHVVRGEIPCLKRS